MNQQVVKQPEAIRASEVGMATGNGSKVAPQNLAEVVRFAEVMSNGGIALPQHLRGNAGTCMAVTLQALEWQMNPFAVAQKSYEVNGMIAYEAQLLAAVVNTRSGIKGRLKYKFEGEGDDLTCTVTGNVDGDELEYTSPRKGNIRPQNSPLWKTDPQQQLGYYSARAWARRHTPEVLLGVYDREEAHEHQGAENAKDVTPKIPLSQRLEEANASQSGEGFDQEHVLAETAQYTEIEEDETDIGEEAEPISAQADAPEDQDLPTESSGAPEEEESDDSTEEQNAADIFIEAIQGKNADEVQALVTKHMESITKLPIQEQGRAESARKARLKAIAQEAIDG